MKRLRKLLGILLTGVMALTLLAGCAADAALNEKEIAAALSDYYRLEYPEDEVSVDTTNYAQNAVKALQSYYETLPEGEAVPPIGKLFSDPADPAGLCKKVPAGSKDEFWIDCLPLEQYQSRHLNRDLNFQIATNLYYDPAISEPLTDFDSQADRIAISVSTGTINGDPYIIAIYRFCKG